jgi:heme-degrading monooxygenase HmoA
MLAHAVYFTLHDPSPANLQGALASVRELLSGPPGMSYFAAGLRGAEFARPVNDADFDVALFTVFDDKEAHDRYQVSPRHLAFIEQNKKLWKSVRVFDAYVAG